MSIESEARGMGSRQTESADGECPSGRDGDCGSCPRASSTNRRLLLKSVAAGGTLALAGCAGLFETESEEEPDNYVNDSLQNTNGGDTGGENENGNGNGEQQLYDVEFLRAQQTVEIGAEEIILEAGENAGLDLPFQCRVGRCGQCEAKVNGDANEFVDMSDDQTALSEDEIADGSFLTCVSSPTTDFACDERPDNEGDPLADVEPGGGGSDTFDVTYLGVGSGSETVGVGTDETLLEAGKDEDFNLKFQCEVGVCGQCESSYDGNANDVVDMDGNQYLDDEEIENGALLTCVSTPKTDFEFEPATE